jgi:Protein of unknown function (DUF1176)
MIRPGLMLCCRMLCCLCALPGAAAAATAPLQREFRDWVLTCDNTRDCLAEGLDADNPTLVVRFARRAGPAGSARVSIDGVDAGGALAALRLDDRPLALDAAAWTATDDGGLRTWSSNDEPAARRFAALIRDGKQLGLGDGSASLDGFAAAMLLMDEVQGRVGTPTAWARPGDKPASAVPAGADPPRRRAVPFLGPALTAAQSRALLAAAKALADDATSDCDLADDDEPQTQVARLNDADALVLVECGRGAYQSGYRAYRGPIAAPGELRQIALPSAPGRPASDWLMDADYHAPTATLSQFSKGRGLADCGEATSWLFDGRAFVLESLAIEPRCLGVMLDFPVLWRNQ